MLNRIEVATVTANAANANTYRERIYENKGFPALIDLVRDDEKHVLDVGCGVGGNIDLLQSRGHTAVGVTLSEAEAAICTGRGFECVIADVSETMPFEEQTFDAVILSHILEHLPWPDQALNRIARVVRPGGSVYVALPNVLHVAQRLKFLAGDFRYTETGLMDRTHLRFYDFESARALLTKAGLEVRQHFGIGPVPLGPIRRLSARVAAGIDRLGAKRWPGLFAFHLIIVATVPASFARR
jgi:SAM-dependent methyltransferase